MCGRILDCPGMNTTQIGNTLVAKETQAICDSIGADGTGEDEDNGKKDGTQDSLL